VNYTKKQNIPKDGTLNSFLILVRSYFPEDVRHMITSSTAHKFKGLEKKVVIVLDAVPRCYPLLHPDLMFTRVFGDTIERVVEEERRLFYVALTRAVEHLLILTEANNVSFFLEDLKSRKAIPTLDWSDYKPLAISTGRITIRVGNQNGRGGSNTYAIKDLLKADGYRWNTTGWTAWCRNCPAQCFSVHKFFGEALWISHADGIEVRFYDDLENEVGIYCIDKGQWTCVVSNLHFLE
jgi:DNA helicase IV